MAAVGSLIFCITCGNLLDSAVGKEKLDCSQCQSSYDAKPFVNLSVVTTSADDAFPSALKLKRSVVKTQLGKEHLEEGAIVSAWNICISGFISIRCFTNDPIRSRKSVLSAATRKCNTTHCSSEVQTKV